jgi:hypothetical protein
MSNSILRYKFLFSVLFLAVSFWAYGQAYVSGTIKDNSTENPLESVQIYILEKSIITFSDDDGNYKIQVPVNESFELSFSRLGYKPVKTEISPLGQGVEIRFDVLMENENPDISVTVTGTEIERSGGMILEKVEELKYIPSTSGNFESVLPHIALGTNPGRGGELTSQYNVRGGNYDENLVYVNGFEIFRPQLIRSGQQEGLSFPNIDLIRDLKFSSGGFDSKYGDKMSSVLDIRYKLPDSLSGGFSASMLGASAYLLGAVSSKKDKYKKLRYLTGVRYKTHQYLLNTLDTKGEYLPTYIDLQTYLTYDLSPNLQLEFIGNYNSSNFNFIPESGSTAKGLINFALKLSTDYEGAEEDRFRTAMGGLSMTWIPDRTANPLYMKLLVSGYQGVEQESFDILGFYRLSQIETNFGSDDAGEEVSLLGQGIQHQYTRNFLYSNIVNSQILGGIEFEIDRKDLLTTHFLEWGLKHQYTYFFDKINEWELIDSSGYSLQYDEEEVLLNYVLKSTNETGNSNIEAFFQDTYSSEHESRSLRLTAGLRASYRTLSNEFLASPRVSLLIKPRKNDGNITYKVASGLYFQPPFYREMRRPDGSLNTDLKSQKSFHAVAGFSFDFDWTKISDKKFKLIVEAYYKRLWNLVSYDYENVLIRYSGENDATGYIAGLDLRINGEFVPGAESWVNLSLLRARESLTDIQHQERQPGQEEGTPVKDVPRPTDQFLTLNMFFQDYLPKNENFKMHLNLALGTGTPFGIPGKNKVYRNTYRYSPYHRIDIGFAYQLWDEKRINDKPRSFLRFTKSTWLGLEIYNLMDIRNEASNRWIKTIFSQQYAIPNYLTSRRVNLQLKVDF